MTRASLLALHRLLIYHIIWFLMYGIGLWAFTAPKECPGPQPTNPQEYIGTYILLGVYTLWLLMAAAMLAVSLQGAWVGGWVLFRGDHKCRTFLRSAACSAEGPARPPGPHCTSLPASTQQAQPRHITASSASQPPPASGPQVPRWSRPSAAGSSRSSTHTSSPGCLAGA